MFKIRSSNISVNVSFNYSPTIFEWQNVSSRYFEMIESKLVPILGISDLGNFTVQSGNSVGDIVARYDIFGGKNSVSLRANSLSAEFPNLLPGDSELVINIIRAVYSGFRERFSERKCSVTQVRLFDHVKLIDGKSQEYLYRYLKPFQNTKPNELDLEFEPTGRIFVKSIVDNWNAICMVEKSELLENSLFLQIILTLNINEDDNFDTILDSFYRHFNSCVSILDLQYTNEE